MSSTSIALPLDPNSVTVTNMGFTNNQAVATTSSASIAIVPIPQPSGQIFNNLSASLIYQPQAHSYLPNSNTGNILVDSTLVDNLNSNNYTHIDFDINNELVSLEINTEVVLYKNINLALTSIVNFCSNSTVCNSYFQYGNYMYIYDLHNNVWQIEFNSNGSIGNWTNLGNFVGSNNNLIGTNYNILVNYVQVNNGYVYLVDNQNNNIIEQFSISNLGIVTTPASSINIGDDLGAFNTSICAFTIGSNLYVLGSNNSNYSASNVVYSLTIDSTTGTISAPVNSGIVFPITSHFYKMIEVGNVYYFFTSGQAGVYTPTIDSTTNKLTGFTLAGNLPAVYSRGYSLLNLNGTIYVFGTGSNNTNIWVGTVDATNNTISFSISSLITPVPVYGCAVGYSSTNVYIFGSYTHTDMNNDSQNYTSTFITSIPYSGSNLLQVIPEVVLPATIANGVMLNYEDYAYILGGVTASNTPTDIMSFTYVNEQNGPGATVSGTNLPIAVYDHTAIIIGTSVYLIGGNNGTTTLNTIYQGTIQSNGNISGWTELSITLPYAVAGAAITATTDNIYLIGGYTSTSTGTVSGFVDSVIMIPITNPTILGTPVTSSITLPQAIYYASAINTNGIIYLAGGKNSTSSITNVYNSLINPDGTINSFADTGNDLPTNYGAGQLVLWNNFLFYIGGTTGYIYQSYIAANYFGPWNSYYNSLPTAWNNMQAVVVNNYLFVAGGINNDVNKNTVYYYNLNDTNTYSLIPSTPFSQLPNNIYLLGNLQAQGLIGDTSNGDTLSNLSLNDRNIATGIVTYQFNPTFANDASLGGNAYYQINNLNEGDTVITISGVIGSIDATTSTSTTSTTSTSTA